MSRPRSCWGPLHAWLLTSGGVHLVSGHSLLLEIQRSSSLGANAKSTILVATVTRSCKQMRLVFARPLNRPRNVSTRASFTCSRRSQADPARINLRNMHVFNPQGGMNSTEWRIAGKFNTRDVYEAKELTICFGEKSSLMRISCVTPVAPHPLYPKLALPFTAPATGVYMALVFRKTSTKIQPGELIDPKHFCNPSGPNLAI